MFKNILVAVAPDDMESAKAVLTKATALKDQGGTIRVLTVAEPLPVYLTAELPVQVYEDHLRLVDETLAAIPEAPGGGFEREKRMGNPAAEIMASAEENGCDLIIVSSHKPGLSTYLIGSTAAKVVRHAQCSVLVVR